MRSHLMNFSRDHPQKGTMVDVFKHNLCRLGIFVIGKHLPEVEEGQ